MNFGLAERLKKFNENYLQKVNPNKPLVLEDKALPHLRCMLDDAGYFPVEGQKGLYERFHEEGDLVKSVEFFDKNNLLSPSREEGFSYVVFPVEDRRRATEQEKLKWNFLSQRAKVIESDIEPVRSSGIAGIFGTMVGGVSGLCLGLQYDSFPLFAGLVLGGVVVPSVITYFVQKGRLKNQKTEKRNFRLCYAPHIFTNKDAINHALKPKEPVD